MTVFLWHLTAAMLVISIAVVLGGVGLSIDPGSGTWWLLRPVWLSVYITVLLVLTVVFFRFERSGKAQSVAAWRQVVGATLVCGGLSLLALMGIGGEGKLVLNIWVVLMPFVGAALAVQSDALDDSGSGQWNDHDRIPLAPYSRNARH